MTNWEITTLERLFNDCQTHLRLDQELWSNDEEGIPTVGFEKAHSSAGMIIRRATELELVSIDFINASGKFSDNDVYYLFNEPKNPNHKSHLTDDEYMDKVLEYKQGYKYLIEHISNKLQSNI